MRSALADLTRARRAARPSGAGGFLLVADCWSLRCSRWRRCTGCDHEVDIAPPKAPADATGSTPAAQQTLDGLVAAVRDGSRDRRRGMAAAGSRDLLGCGRATTRRRLRLDDLSMRYVDEGGAAAASQQAELGPGAWRGSVQLGYRLRRGRPARRRGWRPASVFVPARRRAPDRALRRRRRADAAVAGRPAQRRTHGAARWSRSPAASAGRYPAARVARAVHQVRRVLPGWRGRWSSRCPQPRPSSTRRCDAQPGEYDNIAAVTTTEDGSLAPGAPVRVFVNPAVFDRLRQRGAQVVISHEATHVATGATFASMPTWLLEGFADYVALDHAGVPSRWPPRQILARIRKRRRRPRACRPAPTSTRRPTGWVRRTRRRGWPAASSAQEYGEAELVALLPTVSGGTSSTHGVPQRAGHHARARS